MLHYLPEERKIVVLHNRLAKEYVIAPVDAQGRQIGRACTFCNMIANKDGRGL